MIFGIGTDLCPVGRMEKAMENSRFAPRICTPRELERMEPMCAERRHEHLAGLFAAKEAVSKALGTGFSDFGFADIEVLPDAMGKPVCTLSGKASSHLTAMGGETIFITITHDSGMAAATAIIEGGTRT